MGHVQEMVPREGTLASPCCQQGEEGIKDWTPWPLLLCPHHALRQEVRMCVGGRRAGVVLWDILLFSARQDVPKAVCQAGLPVAQGTQPQCWPWGQVRGWHRALHPTHSPLGHRFLLPPVSATLLPSHDKPSDPSPSTCT